jgi:enoyl-CoA hydratase/carnithine racemase
MTEKAQDVLYSIEGVVATLCINRTDRRNALRAATVKELRHGFQDAAQNDQVRVVVLTGAGERSFCTGGDMRDLSSVDGTRPVGPPPFAKLLHCMHDFPKPLVARVNGDAMGGGLGLALACDVSVAVDTARFGTPEINIGLFPWMILPLVAAHVPPRKLSEMALLGQRHDAHKALELGLVNTVVNAGEFDAACNSYIEKLADACPTVLRTALPNLRSHRYPNLPARLTTQQDHFLWNLMQPEVLEGISAFAERRKPGWAIHK